MTMKEGSLSNYRAFLMSSIFAYALMMSFFLLVLSSLAPLVVVVSTLGILTFVSLLWSTRTAAPVPLVSDMDESSASHSSQSPTPTI